jgi:hypothetical protein
VFRKTAIKEKELEKVYLPVRAMMNEMMAARRRILTRRSSNDSLIFSHRDSSSSFSS